MLVAEEKEKFASVEGVEREWLPIDDEWRAACKARLREMRATQVELGDHIGAGQSGISQALSTSKPQSGTELVRPISIALRVQLPYVAQMMLLAVQVASDAAARDLSLRNLQVLAENVRAKKN